MNSHSYSYKKYLIYKIFILKFITHVLKTFSTCRARRLSSRKERVSGEMRSSRIAGAWAPRKLLTQIEKAKPIFWWWWWCCWWWNVGFFSGSLNHRHTFPVSTSCSADVAWRRDGWAIFGPKTSEPRMEKNYSKGRAEKLKNKIDFKLNDS